MNPLTDCEIVTTRIFIAPRNLIYKAWTVPEHLKNWWRPKGFTNTFNKFDFRVGENGVSSGTDRREETFTTNVHLQSSGNLNYWFGIVSQSLYSR